MVQAELLSLIERTLCEVRAFLKTEPEQPERNVTFGSVSAAYRAEVIPKKARLTQRDNLRELALLDAAFSTMPMDLIKPHHVKKYLDERGKTAPVRANRERALFSHVFNFARSSGYTDSANPCAGVRGHREKGRDRYVEHAEFHAVWDQAHYTVQDAMDLAYLTGQRPADVLKINLGDIQDGVLLVTQNKTGTKLRINVTGELKTLLERIIGRGVVKLSGDGLLLDEDGSRLSYDVLFNRFAKAREAAGVDFQFRDLRAKAATDTGDLATAQKLLGHKSRTMTEHYTRNRLGERVNPVTPPTSSCRADGRGFVQDYRRIQPALKLHGFKQGDNGNAAYHA